MRQSLFSNQLSCFLILLCIAALTSCGDKAGKPKSISLQEGYYVCTDTTFAMVFPEGQHDGQYVTTLVMRDSVMIAARPEVVAEYIDSTGTGVVYMGDSVVWLRTNGRDSLWLGSSTDTMVYIRQPEVKHAPKSLKGEWKLLYHIDEIISIRLLDAVIDDQLACTMTFNIPDSAQLAEMIEMITAAQQDTAGSGSDSTGWADMLPEDMAWREMLANLPTSATADIWYSLYAGRGVIVPDTKDLNIDLGLPFTTPNGNTMRFSIGSVNLDMTRKK